MTSPQFGASLGFLNERWRGLGRGLARERGSIAAAGGLDSDKPTAGVRDTKKKMNKRGKGFQEKRLLANRFFVSASFILHAKLINPYICSILSIRSLRVEHANFVRSARPITK